MPHPLSLPLLRRRHDLRLDEAVVVVTGGARGIGAATAVEFARHGARVVIGDLDGSLAETTARQIGANASGGRLDVTDHAGFTAFLDEVESSVGPLAVLVNNAGVMAVTSFEDESGASVQRQLDVNLHAVIHGSQEAIRRMRPRGVGHIVNIASVGGRMAFVGVASYCATKYAVVGLTEAMRRELHGSGIGATCVMPGFVATELTSGVPSHWAVPAATPEHVAKQLVQGVRRDEAQVYVPRHMAHVVRLQSVLPRPLLEASLRLLGGDHLMLDAAGTEARADYDRRMAKS